MPTIMTHLTPHDEMLARCYDESERCCRWTAKECAKVFPEFETFEMPASMNQYISSFGGFELVGYVPWTSPKNGDRWLSLVFCKKEKDRVIYRHTPLYYWDTVGSFGFISHIQFRYTNDPTHCTSSYFCFTDHCMQRVSERLLPSASHLQTILFLYLILEYSAVYTYPRGKKKGMAIVTPFGEFRTIYREDTLADPIRTFIATEQMDEFNRKRYLKNWKMACETIFNKVENSNQILNDDGNTHDLQAPAEIQGPGEERSSGHAE